VPNCKSFLVTEAERKSREAAAETRLDGQTSDFFLSGLQKLEQRAKKCNVFRGECVE
jgi:hypothetical protein